MARFLVYGSSTAQGFHDRKYGGWVNRVEASLIREEGHKYPSHELFKLTVRNETICDTLGYLPGDVNRFRLPEGRIFGIFQLGGADYALGGKEGRGMNSGEFRKELEKLATYSDENLTNSLLVNMHPVGSQPDLTKVGPRFDVEKREEFAHAVQEFAQDYGVPFANVHDEFMRYEQEQPEVHLLAKDNLHPNTAGHALITNLVLQQVGVLLEEEFDLLLPVIES